MQNLRASILIVGILLGSFACNSNDAGEKSENQNFKSKGSVKKIDREKGEITIEHEEIPNLMGAMTMDFPVRDKKLLELVKVNDRVEFELKRENKSVFLSAVTKIGETNEINAAEIYKTNCAKCHGENGEGVKGKGITFLKGHALDHSEEEFIRRVTEGKDEEMPAFKDKISDEEIRSVVNYVREEIQSKADPKNKVPHKH